MFPVCRIHIYIIKIGNLEFCQWLRAFGADKLMTVEHKGAVTELTIMYVHHNSFLALFIECHICDDLIFAISTPKVKRNTVENHIIYRQKSTKMGTILCKLSKSEILSIF